MRRFAVVSMMAGAAALLVAGRGPGSPADFPTLGSVYWKSPRAGVAFGTATLVAGGEGRWTKVILLRLDPAHVRLELATHLNRKLTIGAWTVDDAPGRAVAAFNAGQFSGIAPWGWTVMNGIELRPPGTGPLSMGVVADTAGHLRLVPPDSIAAVRAAGGVATAFQSYPALLTGSGEIPTQLTTEGQGVAVGHRDARLAIGQLTDGTLLVTLTRFDGVGEAGGAIPLGLTLAETARLLRSLGAVRAVALDGGISAQLMVRNQDGSSRTWHAWRKVPVGVLITGT
jgi:hypothetical protein